MADFDAVVVGSGVNSLACGALLARAGWRVCVLERNDWLGGAIHTAEITEPGFMHDVFSAWHPLWVGGAAHAQLGADLSARGLEYLNTALPTATAFPDGHAAFLLREAAGNAKELGPEWPGMLERFFPNADLAFGVIGTELWSPSGLALGAKVVQPSPASFCRRAATGFGRRSSPSTRTACSLPGCCTPGSGPMLRRPGS